MIRAFLTTTVASLLVVPCAFASAVGFNPNTAICADTGCSVTGLAAAGVFAVAVAAGSALLRRR